MKKHVFDIANLLVTILIALMIPCGLWVAKTWLDNRDMHLKQELSQTYVTNDVFNTSRSALQLSQEKTWSKINEVSNSVSDMRVTIVHLTDSIDSMETTVNRIAQVQDRSSAPRHN
jgi:hypothetical protein